MRIRALVIMLTLLALTGCVQLPQPVSPTEAPRPAMTLADAEDLHALLTSTMQRADRKRSQSIADDVLTGTDLAGQVATYDKHDRYGLAVDPPTQGVKILGVYSSEAAAYPQRAVVVSTQKATKEVKDYRLLEVWVRATAADPWLRSSSVSIQAKDLRALKSDRGLASFITAGKVGGMSVDSMKPLADAFDQPTRQRTFKPDDFLTVWRDWAKDDTKDLDNCDISQIFSGGDRPTVIRTEEGGALVIGRVSITRTAQVKASEEGSYIYWPKGYMRREHPGHYRMTVDSYLLTALVLVPPKGKPDLNSFTWWWTGTDAFE